MSKKDWRSKTILVVEDETSLLSIIENRLKRDGFRVLKAVNGIEGLELALKEHPDLIFLDVLMPIEDGLCMIKKLRRNEWGKNAKVVVLTNLSHDVKKKDFEKHDVLDYLLKTDWKIEEIGKKAVKWLE